MLICLAVVIAGSHFAGKAYYYNKYKPAIKEGSKVEYAIYTEYKDRPVYLTKIIAKTDTVHWVDSVYYEKPITVAIADTLIKKDSSSIKIKYYYPPLNYFSIDMNIREKIITQKLTVTQPYEPSFFDRFNLVLFGGVGYDIIEKQPTISIGIGIGINLNKIF